MSSILDKRDGLRAAGDRETNSRTPPPLARINPWRRRVAHKTFILKEEGEEGEEGRKKENLLLPRASSRSIRRTSDDTTRLGGNNERLADRKELADKTFFFFFRSICGDETGGDTPTAPRWLGYQEVSILTVRRGQIGGKEDPGGVQDSKTGRPGKDLRGFTSQ